MIKNIMLMILTLVISSQVSFGKTSQKISVYLTDVQAPYTLVIDGKYKAYNYMYESEIVSALEGQNSVVLNAHELGLKIDEVGVYKEGIVFETSENGFNLNGIDYYGDIMFVPYEGKLIPINTLKVEDYVKGVLPHEMSPDWPVEALKAQAVAARTYAMFHILNNDGKKPFDVDDTTKYQVYNGKVKINWTVTQAVDSTKYEIATYEDRVIASYFFALCGGHTDSALNAFGASVPYLGGVACQYCNAKITVWTNAVTYDHLNSTFGKDYNFNATPDSKIITKKADLSSGKVSSVAIEAHDINARDFRSALTPSVVPSLNFSIKQIGNGLVVTGVGNGHGVGLCQWGAFGMAQVKKDYKEILNFYYKGIDIQDYTTMDVELVPDVW